MFDLPSLGLTLRCGPLCLDIGAPLPIGARRLSRNLGYVGVGVACLSWDWR